MINSWTENYGEQFFMGLDLDKLHIDQCYLTINNNIHPELYLYEKYEECHNCPYLFTDGPFKLNDSKVIIMNTKFPKLYRLLTEQFDKVSANINWPKIGSETFGDFHEFGVYQLNVNKREQFTLDTLKEPVNIYFPILTVFIIYGILFSLIPIGRFLWDKIRFERLDTYPITREQSIETRRKRVLSLDTFRGLCIVLMVFVNYGSGGFPFLGHAVWNGLCVGDLVFPWFMWIMGVCIPISITSQLKKGISRTKMFKNITKRSCILFALGLFLGASPYLETMRLFGVLQRFAICYFIVATLNLCAIKREELQEVKGKYAKIFVDLLELKVQWIFMLVLITLHTCLIFLFEIPSCANLGYLGPGGLHDDGLHEGCTGGVTGYIDRLILGNHVYQNAEVREIYKSQAFEPEGILGCLTSIFQVFLGVQAGMILKLFKDHKNRLLRWLAWSAATGMIAGILCGFSKDDGLIPLNKQLWSLSFVFATSCLAFLLLAICYFLIDAKGMWSGKPFLFAGMNAIFMYVGHSMTYGYFPIHWYLSREYVNPTHFMMLVENVWATSIWVLIAYYLYRIKFFLSI